MSDRSPLPASRRAVLGAGGVSIASVAGCSALSSQSSTLDLLLYNHTDSPYTVELRLLRVEDGSSRSTARVYSEAIEVEPEQEARREDVAELRRYLVRYEAYEDNSNLTDEDHVHYYPVDDGDDDGMAFDIHSPGVMTRR